MQELEIVKDEETGLPVLPEGYFWRVTDGLRYSRVGSDRLMLEIRKEVVDTDIVRETIGYSKWRSFWYGDGSIYAYVNKEFPSSENVWSGVVREVREFSSKEEAEDIHDQMHADGWEHSDDTTYYRFPEPTKELIYESACRAYRNWMGTRQKELEREAKRERLEVFIGDYPPKKI